MQIPPASSASQAASILAQSTSKDKSTSAGAADASGVQNSLPHVEKSESTDPDRDAQGQGDGFDHQPKQPHSHDDILDVAHAETTHRPAPQLPGEPPSSLDIVG